MQVSTYNVLAPAAREGESILYNTQTRACAILDARDVQEYERIAGADAAGPCDVSDSELARQLADMGFLVESRSSEIGYMRYQFEKYKFNDRVFELYIAPTLDCNFSCIYCYEHKRKGRMTLDVADAVFDFVKEEYDNQPYKELKINWYGGEPLLCMDIIEYLSERFLAFVDEKGIEYYAAIITNAALADEGVQNKLKKYRVWCVMATVDGIGEMHDRTRPSRDGRPTYETIMNNVEGFLEKDFAIDFRCVVDRENCSSCLELAEKIAHLDNINVELNQMRDLTDFEENDPRAGAVSILSPAEHAHVVLDEFLQRDPGVEDFEKLLRPLHVYCAAAIDRAYTIDELGNAYKCTSMPGMDDRILFNVTEPMEQRAINAKLIAKFGNSNPLDNEECARCAVYPLCAGGCSRTRVETGVVTCKPFKYMIGDLLTEYSKVL